MWPAFFRSLVEAHRETAVWSMGLLVLGYPPTWCTSGKELKQVREALETVQKGKVQ